METYLIKNISIINEDEIRVADVCIKNGRIEKIASQINLVNEKHFEINGEGKYLLPGAIDDQVHFREPGLTHKASIYTESKAAVAGGITSFMEMPNTVPNTLTQELLENKYQIGATTSLANYSFFMGVANDNVEEVLKTNDKKKEVCGVKIFMGSSTGNMLVNNPLTLEKIFSDSELLIATHCEDERIIAENLAKIKAEGRALVASDHPLIRNEEACFESSFYAVQMAKKYDARLHILHISTEKELQLFSNMLPLKEKRITAEVCVHHLHFTSEQYYTLGNKIKCNPAIKAPHNREALWNALLDDRLDVIATDHAPHLLTEKFPQQTDFSANAPIDMRYDGAAGLPLVQHSLLLMLYYYKQGKISLEKIVRKMSHAVAECFQLKERGYIREGYQADLVMVDLNKTTTVTQENILYKCGWSPLNGFEFPARITHTFVNGNLVYKNEGEAYGNIQWDESHKGSRLQFDR